MSDPKSALNVQGKKVKCIYGYKATMNDELNIKIDDIIVLTQCSEDETWLEGTLNGVTGWFPSNYVQPVETERTSSSENETTLAAATVANDRAVGAANATNSGNNNTFSNFAEYAQDTGSLCEENQSRINETLRIKYINELKRIEEGFLDEMCKFVKMALLPLQSANEIFPMTFVQQLNGSVDEIIRCHQMFYQQIKEIPDNSDAKIGNLLMNLAGHFKSAYETYARSNPKYTNIITKKRDQLSKFFEASLGKLVAALLPTVAPNTAVAIYMTKFLAAPFKQLEIYVKILKEIHRYTEDYHIDRGDLQRCIEFYSSLLLNVQETRKKKEYELDILSSKINNLDPAIAESLLKNINNATSTAAANTTDVLFISTVLVVMNDHGEIRDRIMLILPGNIVFLKQSVSVSPSSPPSSCVEFDFDFKVTLPPSGQIRKIADLDTVNAHYGGNLINSSLTSSYVFELLGVSTAAGANNSSGGRLLVACSTQYDMRQSFDLIATLLAKSRAQQGKTISQQPLVRQGSSGSAAKQVFTDTASRDCTSPINFSSPNGQNNNNNNNNVNNNNSINNISASASTNTNSFTQPSAVKRVFSLRPHPPLIPHFQLPTDSPHATSLDGSLTLKRFMYKKPKLSEPFGKYHGADDDLKMLNVIESFFKTRIRQSVSVNAAQETTGSSKASKVSVGDSPTASSAVVNGIASDKNLSKIVTKLSEDKSRLEDKIKTMSSELDEFRKSNKELKSIITSMQRQLENEKQMRRKLETFVRKHMRIQNNNGENSPNGDLLSSILMNIEHESSI